MWKQSLEIPLEWFVCPVTKEELTLKGNTLSSSFGQFSQDNQFGFWNFIPEGLENLTDSQWQTWQKLQDNGLVLYQIDPEHNLGVGKRLDFLEFAQFCDFSGLVLDVGVGPQISPTHIEYCQKSNVFFVGIDPLVGEQPRSFVYVQALGEYLPFKSELFDQVIFATSLDHFIDPQLPLAEAKRVLKYDGNICVWLGEKDKNAPKPKQTHQSYEQMIVPHGAEDRFHFKRFTASQFEEYLQNLGLLITDNKIIEIDQWRRNLFYKLKPEKWN